MTARQTGYRHEALYGDAATVTGPVVVPVVLDALAARRRVVLACDDTLVDVVRAGVDADADLTVVQDADLGARTPVALAAYAELVREHCPAGGMLLVTDMGGHSAGWDCWMRTEALLNHTLAELPVHHLCLVDMGSVPSEVRRVAQQTHPLLRREDGVHVNPDYREPEAVLRDLEGPVAPDPLESTEPVLTVLDIEDPRVLRRRLNAVLRDSPLSEDAAQDFVLAIDEVTANAAEHGVPPVDVRLWSSPEKLVCAISDRGSCFDDPLAGYGPAHHGDPSLGGMGLWLARRSVDSLTAQATDVGCTVRLVVSA